MPWAGQPGQEPSSTALTDALEHGKQAFLQPALLSPTPFSGAFHPVSPIALKKSFLLGMVVAS